jgi:hypothetical protein
MTKQRRPQIRAFLTIGLVALLLGTTSVVAVESYREYDRWDNRPLGILEHLLHLQTHNLPQAPGWSCVMRPPPPVDGVYHVQPAWIGKPAGELPSDGLAAGLKQRIPFNFEFRPWLRFQDNDAARDFARAHPGLLVVGLSETHHRGAVLNEKMEGFACQNLVVVASGATCLDAVLGHEVGHVFGLRHARAGLMKPRDLSCDDRLLSQERERLLADHHAFVTERRSNPSTLTPDS